MAPIIYFQLEINMTQENENNIKDKITLASFINEQNLQLIVLSKMK
jgi:hypothetical protein